MPSTNKTLNNYSSGVSVFSRLFLVLKQMFCNSAFTSTTGYFDIIYTYVHILQLNNKTVIRSLDLNTVNKDHQYGMIDRYNNILHIYTASQTMGGSPRSTYVKSVRPWPNHLANCFFSEGQIVKSRPG